MFPIRSLISRGKIFYALCRARTAVLTMTRKESKKAKLHTRLENLGRIYGGGRRDVCEGRNRERTESLRGLGLAMVN